MSFPPNPSTGGGAGGGTWGSIAGTLSDQTDLNTALNGKASKTESDLTLYVYEDATGTGDGSSKANGFTALQDAIDVVSDIAGNVTIIVCKGSTNYLGQTTTIQKASVKSLTIKGEFYAYEACDANAVAGKIVDASADFSDFEVGDRVVCTHYSGIVGSSSIDDYFYATITEVGSGYVQTSESTKVPTTGWRYLINQTVFDGNAAASGYLITTNNVNAVILLLGITMQNSGSAYFLYAPGGTVTINRCIFYESLVILGTPNVWITLQRSAFLGKSTGIPIYIARDSGCNMLDSVISGSLGSTIYGVYFEKESNASIEFVGIFNCAFAIRNAFSTGSIFVANSYIASTCTYGAYGYNITLSNCTNNAATPVYNLTSGGSIEEWDRQALPSIDDATGGQVLALKSDKSALEFASKQPLDATLTALAGVTTAANKLPYATGEDAFDVCDFTSFGRSLIGTTTASAVRDLIAAASSTTATQNIYVDSAATGAGTGVDWTNAFTTIQAAINSLPAIINHAVTIWIRNGTTPYAENVTVQRVVAAGSITIRGEYYWWGTVAATATGKITLGSGNTGYADRAQIAAGDQIWATKWSGAIGASTPEESIIDTVASVSDAEVTLTTNTAQEFDTTWSYRIVKTKIQPAAGIGIRIQNVFGVTAIGLHIVSASNAVFFTNTKNCYAQNSYFESTAGHVIATAGQAGCMVSGNCIKGTSNYCRGVYAMEQTFLISSGNVFGMSGTGCFGLTFRDGCIAVVTACDIVSSTVNGISASSGSNVLVSTTLNSATTPKTPVNWAASTDGSYIS